MKNKYEIVWQDPQQKVLQILALENPTRNDILEAALRALEIVNTVSHDTETRITTHYV